MSDWIKCSEMMPEIGISQLVWGTLKGERCPAAHEAFRSGRDVTRWNSVRTDDSSGDWVPILNVTHWQPMPEGPNED